MKKQPGRIIARIYLLVYLAFGLLIGFNPAIATEYKVFILGAIGLLLTIWTYVAMPGKEAERDTLITRNEIHARMKRISRKEIIYIPAGEKVKERVCTGKEEYLEQKNTVPEAGTYIPWTAEMTKVYLNIYLKHLN